LSLLRNPRELHWHGTWPGQHTLEGGTGCNPGCSCVIGKKAQNFLHHLSTAAAGAANFLDM